eukprot:1160256-Pelagomonas_calceolata.AAC.23
MSLLLYTSQRCHSAFQANGSPALFFVQFKPANALSKHSYASCEPRTLLNTIPKEHITNRLSPCAPQKFCTVDQAMSQVPPRNAASGQPRKIKGKGAVAGRNAHIC